MLVDHIAWLLESLVERLLPFQTYTAAHVGKRSSGSYLIVALDMVGCAGDGCCTLASTALSLALPALLR